MDEFLGSWRLESNEGLNELLIRLGIGYLTRKTLNASKPILTFTRERGPGDPEVGEMFSMKITSTLKSASCYFRIGYAFDENTIDGRTVHTLFTIDGPMLKQEQHGTKTTHITYTIDGDLLKTVSYSTEQDIYLCCHSGHITSSLGMASTFPRHAFH